MGCNVEFVWVDVSENTCGESNSPRSSNFCVQQFMQFSLFQPHFRSFTCSFYLFASPMQDEMPRNRQRTKSRENEAEKATDMYCCT